MRARSERLGSVQEEKHTDARIACKVGTEDVRKDRSKKDGQGRAAIAKWQPQKSDKKIGQAWAGRGKRSPTNPLGRTKIKIGELAALTAHPSSYQEKAVSPPRDPTFAEGLRSRPGEAETQACQTTKEKTKKNITSHRIRPPDWYGVDVSYTTVFGVNHCLIYLHEPCSHPLHANCDGAFEPFTPSRHVTDNPLAGRNGNEHRRQLQRLLFWLTIFFALPLFVRKSFRRFSHRRPTTR